MNITYNNEEYTLDVEAAIKNGAAKIKTRPLQITDVKVGDLLSYEEGIMYVKKINKIDKVASGVSIHGNISNLFLPDSNVTKFDTSSGIWKNTI